MTANSNEPAILAAFETFLEVHGSNRSRWPAQKRLEFASLLATSADARRLLSEAEALDRLLGTMDEADAAKKPASYASLTARILTTAVSESDGLKATAPEAGAKAPGMVPSSPVINPASNVVVLRPAPRPRRALWPVGAMMAASLLLGITTGLTTMTTLNATSEVAAAETSNEIAMDPAVLALDNDSYGPLGGDLL